MNNHLHTESALSSGSATAKQVSGVDTAASLFLACR